MCLCLQCVYAHSPKELKKNPYANKKPSLRTVGSSGGLPAESPSTPVSYQSHLFLTALQMGFFINCDLNICLWLERLIKLLFLYMYFTKQKCYTLKWKTWNRITHLALFSDATYCFIEVSWSVLITAFELMIGHNIGIWNLSKQKSDLFSQSLENRQPRNLGFPIPMSQYFGRWVLHHNVEPHCSLHHLYAALTLFYL